jgi:hypothetical protein
MKLALISTRRTGSVLVEATRLPSWAITSSAAPSAPVARHIERVESRFRELSATTRAHPVAEIRS